MGWRWWCDIVWIVFKEFGDSVGGFDVYVVSLIMFDFIVRGKFVIKDWFYFKIFVL